MLLELVVDNRQAGEHELPGGFANLRKGLVGSEAQRSFICQADDVAEHLLPRKCATSRLYATAAPPLRHAKAYLSDLWGYTKTKHPYNAMRSSSSATRKHEYAPHLCVRAHLNAQRPEVWQLP